MVLLLHGGGVHQVLGGLHPGVHVGQLELGVLELAQALLELHALLGVLHGLVDGALAQAQSLRGDADTASVQGHHGDLEALALLTQQVLLGNDAVLKDQVAGGGAADAHLLLVLAHGEALVSALHDERGQLLGLAAPLLNDAGDGDDDEHVGIARVGDEDLGAVEHPVPVLILHGGGLLALSIGARPRLGESEGPDPLARAQLGQVLLLLLLGAVLKDGVAAQAGVGGQDDGRGAAHLGHLLHRHHVGQVIGPRPAVLLGQINAHHAQLGHLFDGLLRETLLLVHIRGDGLDLILREILEQLLEHCLLFGQFKIHVFLPPYNLPAGPYSSSAAVLVRSAL